MSRWPPEITGSLDPRPDELARLDPPAAPTWCSAATDPDPAEIDRLRSRAATLHRPTAPQRGSTRARWALAAVLVVLAVLHLVPMPHVPSSTALHGDTVLRFGPSITVTGEGELEVLRADERGTELALRSGRATFEVDPTGARRHLEVHAGEVRVEVTGTRFTVWLEQAQVGVEVLRGSVLVHRPTGSLQLRAGEHWGGPEGHPQPTTPLTTAPAPIDATAAMVDLATPHSEPQPGSGSAPAADTSSKVIPGPPVPDPRPSALVEPGDAGANTAAHAWAELLAARSSDDPAELQLERLERFLVQHDDQVLAAEAGALRLALLSELMPAEEVLPELDSWLRTHPSHARSLEVELLRATVAREQLGDCTLALPSYRRVAREADGALRTSAQAWFEHCQAEAR